MLYRRLNENQYPFYAFAESCRQVRDSNVVSVNSFRKLLAEGVSRCVSLTGSHRYMARV